MASIEKVFTQIQPPTTTYKEDPHAVLSQSEQRIYDEVLGHFTKLEPAYSIPNFEKGELMDEEKFWLSRECILRYNIAKHPFVLASDNRTAISGLRDGKRRQPYKD